MNRTVLTTLTAAMMLTMGLATATADSVVPVGPVTNGDFETFVAPDEIKEPLQGTPADECVGIGHQVNWGEDSPQGALTGDDFSEAPTDPEQAPERVADRYGDDPAGQAASDAREQSGYGHCVFSDEEGHDAYWLNPSSAGGTTDDAAAFWSVGDTATAGFNFDDDPFDKEIRVESSPSNGGDHNLWQNVFNPGRTYAFTANFDGLAFDLEDGEIPDDASVKVSLGAEPLNVQERFTAPAYIDCVLGFPGSALQASADANDGRVSVSPLNAEVGYSGPSDPDCPDEKTEENLGRLTIVQLSFWDFNDGTEPVVIDDVALDGATAHAEEAADGNLRICTDTPAQAVDDATCGDDTVGK